MAREQIVNNAFTYLFGDINDTVTALTVVDASQFPSGGNFIVAIHSELIQVTAVTGSIFTCVRGREGTVAAAHSDGAAVAHILSSGSVVQHVQNDVPLFDESATPASNHLVDVSGNVLTASSFTPVNQGDSTLSDYASGGVHLSFPLNASLNVRLYKKSAPTPPYKLTVQMPRWLLAWNSTTQAGYAAIGFRESSSGKFYQIQYTGQAVINTTWWNSPTSWAGGATSHKLWVGDSLWLQIEDEGGAGDLVFRYGIDGIHWNEHYSVDRDSFMAGGPDEISLNGITWSVAVNTQRAVFSTWIEE